MATRTKKVKAAEDKDCGFMTAFKELGLEKGINRSEEHSLNSSHP